MIGIFVLIILGLWTLFAIWFGKLLSKKVFARFTTNQTTGEATKIGNLITILLIAIVFILPVVDQLIAYPKWQQLCSTTGDFEWGPGMDEKKVFGREYYAENEIKTFNIFPKIEVFSDSVKVFDANTNELLFFKPHYGFSAKPLIKLPDASGGGASIFLHKCNTYGLNGKNYEKELHLKWINKKGDKK